MDKIHTQHAHKKQLRQRHAVLKENLAKMRQGVDDNPHFQPVMQAYEQYLKNAAVVDRQSQALLNLLRHFDDLACQPHADLAKDIAKAEHMLRTL
jgi:hypothetical protein